MKSIKLLLAIVLVGIGCALTYHVFENVVHVGIDLIWYDWFNTDTNRLLVIPLTVSLALAYFGLQHVLDKKSEAHQEHGLGDMPKPTVVSYLKVLLLGFLSLVAGASLGPEAVLVPACMILGAMVGTKMFGDARTTKMLIAAAITALFTAFFHSLLIGVLSVLLVTKQAKTKLSPVILLVAFIASVAAYLTLLIVEGSSYFVLPEYNWHLGISTVLVSLCLAAAGYVVIYGMHYLYVVSDKVHVVVREKGWLINALVASLVLAVLYMIGGPLIEFTGNHSIVPLLDQAETLGLVGLLLVLVTKVAAMAWSKGIGYRGGMIFPTLFVATVLVAIVQLYVNEFNMVYGLIAVLVGAFVADHKTHILT